jgi:hypothetical protein
VIPILESVHEHEFVDWFVNQLQAVREGLPLEVGGGVGGEQQALQIGPGQAGGERERQTVGFAV